MRRMGKWFAQQENKNCLKSSVFFFFSNDALFFFFTIRNSINESSGNFRNEHCRLSDYHRPIRRAYDACSKHLINQSTSANTICVPQMNFVHSVLHCAGIRIKSHSQQQSKVFLRRATSQSVQFFFHSFFSVVNHRTHEIQSISFIIFFVSFVERIDSYGKFVSKCYWNRF